MRLDDNGEFIRYYDRSGRPLGLWEWATKFEDRSYQQVECTEVFEGIMVRTIWMGLDHSSNPGDHIEIFETMVWIRLDEPRWLFGRLIEDEGTECYRWSTEEEALAGHRRIVAELRAVIALPIHQED